MKIAVSSLVWTKKPLREALAFIANNGLTYVDLGTLQGWAHVHPQQLVDGLEEQAASLSSLLEEFGLKVIAFNGGVRSLEQWDALLTFANRMNVQSVTLGAARKDADWDAEIARLQQYQQLASSRNVKFSVETHTGTLTEQPETALKLVQAVPGLGLTLDISHYYVNHLEQHAEMLLPYVYHIHVRDCGRTQSQIQMPYGKGLFAMKPFFDLLKKHQYQGHISVEYIDLANVAFNHADSAVKCAKDCLQYWEEE